MKELSPDSIKSIIKLKTESLDSDKMDQMLEEIKIQMIINSDSVRERVNKLILELEIDRKIRDIMDSVESKVPGADFNPLMN